ncbi:MAG: hypothetical protein PQ612_05170 [Rickettsiales bacterium]|nr:hypothetical protein [Pseudomonadota bacterium]MDA0966410.1 hypothetical protein [Pseudomonadota bacterium]MDG4543272.1 hypothetical protein [Rickettsiales bacterium]MDG4545538.1 hypothetical protein [Rickettsiales bacterium]MDG4547987.1 hypothetical protein [Rickettsiales bacterium]
MTPSEAYSLLFVDSFTVMLLIPLKYIFIFEVMKIFGTYNPYLVCAIASFGFAIASIANWGLGKMVQKAFNFEPEAEKAVKLINFLKKNDVIILSLSVIPFAGSVITTAYGAIGGKFTKIVPTVFIAHFIYFYIYYSL